MHARAPDTRAPVVLVLALALASAAGVRTACAVAKEGDEIVFDCGGELISAVDFGSYGRPRGECESDDGLGSYMRAGTFEKSACNAPRSESVLEDRCLGQATCIFTVSGPALLGAALPCPGAADSKRWLAAQLTCGDTSAAAAVPSATRSAGVGWHFVGFVVGVLGLYFGLGVAYNVRRNGAKGLEALPHLDMWRDLPWLVKDGVVFSIDTIKSRGLRRANYDGVL